jgi:hypothetical protein
MKTAGETFKSWDLKSDDNLDVNEIALRFFDYPEKLLNVAGIIDEYSSIFLLSQQIQMVIGGLKPLTTIDLNMELIDLYKQNNLAFEFDMSKLSAALFEYFSVRVEMAPQTHGENIVRYYISNPSCIAKLYKKYDKVNKFNDESIADWIDRQRDSGYKNDFIWGILSGYPISAIKQFCKYTNGDVCRLEGRKRIVSYGEAYYVWGKELKRDVMIRETFKEMFFTRLAQNNVYIQLMKDLNTRAEPYRVVSKKHFEQQLFNNSL